MKTKILTALSCLILITMAEGVFADNIISKNDQIILTTRNQESGPKVEWIPSEEQTSIALNAIHDFLRDKKYSGTQNEQREIILNQISNYRIQFIGILINGRKIIHCNFFPKQDRFEYAKDEYVFVFDGGTSYWRIDYDIENNMCLNFEVNGDA